MRIKKGHMSRFPSQMSRAEQEALEGLLRLDQDVPPSRRRLTPQEETDFEQQLGGMAEEVKSKDEIFAEIQAYRMPTDEELESLTKNELVWMISVLTGSRHRPSTSWVRTTTKDELIEMVKEQIHLNQ